jgi:hypothetical protein
LLVSAREERVQDALGLGADFLLRVGGNVTGAVGPPAPLEEVLIGIREGDIGRVQEVEQLADACLVGELVGGRLQGLEDGIHQGAEPAQVDLVQFGDVVEEVFEVVDRTELERLVGSDFVVVVSADPIMAEGEIDIPGEDAPVAGLVAVAIEVEILVTLVGAAGDDESGEVVRRGGDIDVVVDEAAALGERPVGGDAGAEGGEVGAVFVFAGFLFRGPDVGAGGDGGVYLVEGAVGIEADPLGVAIVAVFEQVMDGVEDAVGLNADGESPMPEDAGAADHLVGERVADFALVGPVGHEVDVARIALALPALKSRSWPFFGKPAVVWPWSLTRMLS